MDELRELYEKYKTEWEVFDELEESDLIDACIYRLTAMEAQIRAIRSAM